MGLVKEKAAELGEEVDHDTAVKVNHDSYVDGKLYRSEEGRFIYDKTVSKILSKVGMTPKVIVTSGEECHEAIDKL